MLAKHQPGALSLALTDSVTESAVRKRGIIYWGAAVLRLESRKNLRVQTLVNTYSRVQEKYWEGNQKYEKKVSLIQPG